VPVFIEEMKRNGISDCEKRIFGITTLDCIRASSIIVEELMFTGMQCMKIKHRWLSNYD
jgi:hypothetical protein